ncbi:hypothetical protein R1flu_000382 [Riccia fluitans]|uniref:Endonuclease/exonuclease/phosphatase domain-containing protein n=1 Tax=Riccia fluitans TaxID=41844 RepID=A0ABD1Y3G6_9MARC
MTTPDGSRNSTQENISKSMNPGQTQGNSSKRQGGKKTSNKTEQGTFAVDYTEEGKAGAALIIRKNWGILAKGRRGDGTAVWMKARTEIGEIGFVSVHGPRDRSNRARLWKWLSEVCVDGVWILGGDWNSVETWEDSIGDSPIQCGTEQRRWNSLAAQLDLADGWTKAEAAMEEWRKAGHQVEDARCQWELKWGATREYLKRKQKEDRCKETELQEKISEMQQKLREMAANRVNTASADWTKLVAEVWEMETTLAAKWRKFSRLRWIREGDAPSKFFFSTLKVRQAQEEISTLIKDDGTRLEDDDRILEELQQYYLQLYRQHPVSEEYEELRLRILNLVHKRISAAHNKFLLGKPEEEEIRKVILHLKSEKAPGIDGMTAEVLRLLWIHAPGDVVDFVHKFWVTGKLTWKQQTGVIKLIPKEGDRQRIKNWRPLTLLNTGYKLISKLIANRL